MAAVNPDVGVVIVTCDAEFLVVDAGLISVLSFPIILTTGFILIFDPVIVIV